MGHTAALDLFVSQHKPQLVSSAIPEKYWQSLYHKLTNQVFDAGNVVLLVKLDYEEDRTENEPIWALQAATDIDSNDATNIYLIDHAWTYKIEQAKSQLLQIESLRERLANILDLDVKNNTKEEIVDTIFNQMWKFNNFYRIDNAANIEDRLPIWYIMDEIGSAILHNSETPNCRVVPFFYVAEQQTYSLMFPLSTIETGDLLYRDFAEGITDPLTKDLALLPWVPKSFEHISENPEIPGAEYYLNGHIEESLPENCNFIKIKKTKYKVYSQYDLIHQYLTDEMFEMTNSSDDADILWYVEHFKNFASLMTDSPSKLINQFPFEFVVTIKDLLALSCRRSASKVNWLPITYNLVTETGNFVSCFQRRAQLGQDNFWIVKPYNLARGLDMHITDNLNYIMRLVATGPKIVQKYIANPVLFYRSECAGRVKFDVRYVILLKSVAPLEVYVYKNFFLRFSNKPFALSEFDDYEKHFTVMNYNENAVLKHLKCKDFKEEWAQQYPSNSWGGVEEKILGMIRGVFECATVEKPPCGIADNPQSRAVYAADLMIEWDEGGEIQPKILEVNFTPDCKRACEYYPDFYNDIFKLLFLDVDESDVFFKL